MAGRKFSLKKLRGIPEGVIAAVENEEVARFPETPIFDQLASEQGNPLF